MAIILLVITGADVLLAGFLSGFTNCGIQEADKKKAAVQEKQQPVSEQVKSGRAVVELTILAILERGRPAGVLKGKVNSLPV